MTVLERSRPAKLASRLVQELRPTARDAQVAEVCIGLGYTAVRLTDDRTGVAFTFRELADGGCSVFHGLRPLAGRSATELLPLLESQDAIEAAVGLACANALGNCPAPDLQDADVLERLELRATDDVAMIGYFGPLVERLRRRVRSLTIFEQVAQATAELRPAAEAPAGLRQSQVALITATSILNQTVDDLLEAARDCRQVALVGATTPLLAGPFSSTAVTQLSGVLVEDPAAVFRIVAEGGGMRQFGAAIRKVVRPVPHASAHFAR